LKAVLLYFNPKDIPEVLNQFYSIKSIDKILFSYFSYPLVIGIAKGWLTYHPEYTHVMIASNDIMVTEENIKKMLMIAKSLKVVCGVMNVENNDFRFMNICEELPVKNVDYREYKWLKKENLGVIKVIHSGFALMCVRRDIILKDGAWDIQKQLSMDLNFSYFCYEKNIDIFCDTENDMVHLRHEGEFKIGESYPATGLCEDITFLIDLAKPGPTLKLLFKYSYIDSLEAPDKLAIASFFS